MPRYEERCKWKQYYNFIFSLIKHDFRNETQIFYFIMIGDSGGPLYLWDKDKGRKEKRATIIGVVSRGTGCANFNKPGIFTKIQHHLKWIKKVIATGDCKTEK